MTIRCDFLCGAGLGMAVGAAAAVMLPQKQKRRLKKSAGRMARSADRLMDDLTSAIDR